MRIFASRKVGAITASVTVATIALLAAGASAATIMAGAVKIDFGRSVPDLATWGLILVSFAVLGAGLRSRKRAVVLS